MNKQYVKKLIRLAKDLDDISMENEDDDLEFVGQLNYLLGYISALEDEQEKDNI